MMNCLTTCFPCELEDRCPPCPESVAYYTELILHGEHEIPECKPSLENVICVTHKVCIEKVSAIPVNLDNGCIAGYKVMVFGHVTIGVEYSADVCEQNVHFVHFEFPFKGLIMGDACFRPIPLCDHDLKKLKLNACVEYESVTKLDCRTLAKTVVLLLWLERTAPHWYGVNGGHPHYHQPPMQPMPYPYPGSMTCPPSGQCPPYPCPPEPCPIHPCPPKEQCPPCPCPIPEPCPPCPCPPIESCLPYPYPPEPGPTHPCPPIEQCPPYPCPPPEPCLRNPCPPSEQCPINLCPSPKPYTPHLSIPAISKEIATDQTLIIPPQKPPIECILNNSVELCVKNAVVINTPLRDPICHKPIKKVVLTGKAEITVKYVACTSDQQVHAAIFTVPFECLIEWPGGPPQDTPICVCTVPEQFQVDVLGSRRIFSILVIKVDVFEVEDM